MFYLEIFCKLLKLESSVSYTKIQRPVSNNRLLTNDPRSATTKRAANNLQPFKTARSTSFQTKSTSEKRKPTSNRNTRTCGSQELSQELCFPSALNRVRQTWNFLTVFKCNLIFPCESHEMQFFSYDVVYEHSNYSSVHKQEKLGFLRLSNEYYSACRTGELHSYSSSRVWFTWEK